MRMRWHAVCALAVLAPFPRVAAAPPSPADQTGRYTVMAVFLYNFMSFVELPAEAPFEHGPMTIGVLGPNPFGDAGRAIEKKSVNERPIRFRFFSEPAAVEPTHILFVTREMAGRLDALPPNLAQPLAGATNPVSELAFTVLRQPEESTLTALSDSDLAAVRTRVDSFVAASREEMLTAFVGANLLQSSVTGFCPAERVLGRAEGRLRR